MERVGGDGEGVGGKMGRIEIREGRGRSEGKERSAMRGDAEGRKG